MSKPLKIIATVAAVYFTAGAAAFVAASVGAVGALSTIASVANYLAFAALASGVARALMPKPRLPGNPGVSTEYSGTVEPRRIIYGQVRVSGMNVIPPVTTGQDNQNLHQVLALAGHEITAIDQYYAQLETIVPGAVTGTTNDGLVSFGTYSNVLWVRGYLGTDSQTADAILLSDLGGSWSTEHRGRGIPYVAMRYRFDQSKYATGKPEISVLVRGKRVYDPRLDVVPGQNVTNPAYTAYSNNPALCAADLLMDTRLGRKVPASRINWAAVVAAANVCDETLSAGSAPPSGSQKRYTCNVVLSCADDPDENLAVLASAMMGAIYRAGGQWQMFAGAWVTPSFALTADDVVGDVRVQSEIAAREKWNSVRGSYLDATQNFQQVEFQPRISSAFIATDGAQRWKDVQFPACTNEYEAQRNAIILLRQSRNRRSVQVEFALSAYRVRYFQTGTVTIPEIGWTNQTVRCYGWRFNPAGTVTLTLREESAADWANPATADYTVPGSVVTPTIGFTRPGTPLTFTAQAQAAAIDFRWTAGDPVIPGQTYELLEAASGAALGTAVVIWSGTATQATIYKADTTTRDYWIRATFSGQTSAARPTGAGLAAAAGSGGVGSPGPAGLNGAVVYLYQRAASSPALPNASITYTFATGGVTGLTNGWSATIPTGTSPLWVTTATASANTATDTIASGEWATPVILAQDGSGGAPGLNAATVYLFQRTASATPPAVPSANVTYTFATGAATGLTNGWTQSLPTSGGIYRWVTTATALSTSTTDTIAPGEWAAAALLAQDGANGSNGSNGTNGNDGAPGTSTAVVFLFQRTNSSTPPAVPSNTTTFTFASGVLSGINNGWAQTLPTSGGPYRWVTTATAAGTGSNDTIGSGEWATPSILSEDGGITAPPTFSVAISGPGTSFSFGNGGFTLGTYTATPTNGTAPYTYEWFFPEQLSVYGQSVSFSSVTSATNTLITGGVNNLYETTIGVRAIDATGRVAVSYITIFVQHGTPP